MRKVLILTHAYREQAIAVVDMATKLLLEHGLTPVMPANDKEELLSAGLELSDTYETYSPEADVELALVLGGDGSILRAAELVRDHQTPILGVNLGHVGFMAEAEQEQLPEVIARIAAKDYVTRERLALEVVVTEGGTELYRSWALNDVALEKSARERMIEVVLEVDGRPLSSFGCDGVVFSTPTGSTAYNFSAGGPVVWPGVEALLMVPLSAHALFARPLVVEKNSQLAVEVLARSAGSGVIWCDGRRTFELPRGCRVEVHKSDIAVPMIIFEDTPFSDRLVRKFDLPVTGWRGPGK